MKAFGVFLLLCLAAYAGWYGRGWRDQGKAAVQVAVAAELESQVKEYRQQAEDSDRAAAFNGEKVLAHEKTIRHLWAKREAVVVQSSAPIEVRLTTTELNLALCDDEIKAREAQAEAFRAHVAALVTSRDRYKTALDLSERRGDTLTTVASVPKWSAGLGTSIDPRDGRTRVAAVVINHLNRDWAIGGGSINGGAFVVAIRSWGRL